MIVRNIFEAYFLELSVSLNDGVGVGGGGGYWLLAAFSGAWAGLKYVGFMPLLIEKR